MTFCVIFLGRPLAASFFPLLFLLPFLDPQRQSWVIWTMKPVDSPAAGVTVTESALLIAYALEHSAPSPFYRAHPVS